MSATVKQAVWNDDAGVSGTSVSATLTNVQAGSTICVFVTVSFGFAGTLSVSDTVNGTYPTTYDQKNDGASGVVFQTAFSNSQAGSSIVVTASWAPSSNTNKGICAIEVSGVEASALDGHTSVFQAGPGSGTNAISVGPPSPNNVNSPAILVALAFDPTGPAAPPLAGTGFNQPTTSGGWSGFNAGGDSAVIEYLRFTGTSAAATFTVGNSSDGSDNWLSLVQIFDERGQVLPTDAIFYGMT